MTSRRSRFGILAALAGIFANPAASATGAEAIVQAQLAAYNARGVTQMRERYAARFAEPNLHAAVIKRIVMGNIVIDHERVTRTFPEGTGAQDAIAMYEVQGTLITRVWFIFGAKTLDIARP